MDVHRNRSEDKKSMCYVLFEKYVMDDVPIYSDVLCDVGKCLPHLSRIEFTSIDIQSNHQSMRTQYNNSDYFEICMVSI